MSACPASRVIKIFNFMLFSGIMQPFFDISLHIQFFKVKEHRFKVFKFANILKGALEALCVASKRGPQILERNQRSGAIIFRLYT